jgi:tRNA(Ile)-lysidine synthase
MASSRRWFRADADGSHDEPSVTSSHASARVTVAVGRALASHVPRGSKVAVALSGGRDSIALFDATLAEASVHALDVVAVHVHHGLSAHADAWVRFCARLCSACSVPLIERRVDVARGPRKSVEAEARHSRYRALADAAASAGADVVLLAHHQDDQAETVLLQLLRGAGPQGLAAMPEARTDATGLKWLRPLLDVPRAAIDAYVRERHLVWVDDDSNADVRYMRNALRERVVPALASTAPGYPGTVARAAAHQAEAARLADDLASLDAAESFDGATLSRVALAELPAHRARNVLRWFLRERGLSPPSSARLAAMCDQLRNARVDARTCMRHAGAEIGVHRNRIVVHAPPPASFEYEWSGDAVVALPHGVLRFDRCIGSGIKAALLRSGRVVIRSRRGGERIQLAANRPRQALKSLLQHADIPTWMRQGLPLVFCGDALAGVPQIGVDMNFAASAGEDGFELQWDERA